MIDLLSTKKNISVKYLLLTFFVCISMVAWLGISDLRADVDDPEDNTNKIEEEFQNTAQEQHADNIAKEAAFQGHTWSNKDEYDKIVGDYTDEVLELRLSGMGWGEIVHYINREYNYEIHPSVLGLGHTPKSFEEVVHSSRHSRMKSGNNQGQGLALGHSKDNSSNHGGGHGGGNGGGHGGGNGGGKK